MGKQMKVGHCAIVEKFFGVIKLMHFFCFSGIEKRPYNELRVQCANRAVLDEENSRPRWVRPDRNMPRREIVQISADVRMTQSFGPNEARASGSRDKELGGAFMD